MVSERSGVRQTEVNRTGAETGALTVWRTIRRLLFHRVAALLHSGLSWVHPVCTENLNPNVLVMQAAQD